GTALLVPPQKKQKVIQASNIPDLFDTNIIDHLYLKSPSVLTSNDSIQDLHFNLASTNEISSVMAKTSTSPIYWLQQNDNPLDHDTPLVDKNLPFKYNDDTLYDDQNEVSLKTPGPTTVLNTFSVLGYILAHMQ
ncbi:unnamed protein product, partial [Didymodactylos carnosus]